MKNFRTPENLAIIKETINSYCLVMNDFFNAEIKKGKEGKSLNELQVIIKDFLNRNGLNFQAIALLFDSYGKKREMILPIGLILRSIYSDFLTQLYFITFCDNGMDATESFKNEITVLDRDFIKSMVDIMECEAKLPSYINEVPRAWLGAEATMNRISALKLSNTHLYEQDGRLKKVKDLRSTSDSILFTKYDTPIDEPKGNSFMSEAYKWRRIEKHEPFKKYLLVLFGYKIFSQFQHYSNRSNELLEQKHEAFFFYHLCLSINAMTIITIMQIQIVDGQNSEYLDKIDAVTKQMEKIFKNE